MKIKFLTVLSLTVVLLLGACGGKSDADLQNDASTALRNDTDTSNVTVTVNDGVATISGQVADEAAKAKAETLANVDGVKSVTNNVVVAPAPESVPTASADDATLKTRIETALKTKGCDGATVEVKDGVATLRGTVAGAKFGECVMVANEAGAKRIENQLGKN